MIISCIIVNKSSFSFIDMKLCNTKNKSSFSFTSVPSTESKANSETTCNKGEHSHLVTPFGMSSEGNCELTQRDGRRKKTTNLV